MRSFGDERSQSELVGYVEELARFLRGFLGRHLVYGKRNYKKGFPLGKSHVFADGGEVVKQPCGVEASYDLFYQEWSRRQIAGGESSPKGKNRIPSRQENVRW